MIDAKKMKRSIYFATLQGYVIFETELYFHFEGRQEGFLNFIQYFDENSLSKQNNPRWDVAFCVVTSGAILFAYVP